ncbi:MAG: CPBP family intramembrane glutamic endopeptidase [Acidimicrobiales bacterium]
MRDGVGGDEGEASTGDRTLPALALLVVGLATFNVARSAVLPERWHAVAGVAMAGFVALLARWASLGASELGLGRDRLGSGLRWGGAAVAAIVVVVVVGALVPSADEALADARVQVGAGSMLWEVGVVTPFGTVLLEELAFRGVLLGLLLRRLGRWPAVVVSSVLFGLWHVLPTLGTSAGNALASGVLDRPGGLALVVAGNVAATFAAGVAFCWLRLWSGSLVAPVLAHLGTNDVAFVIAWWRAR